MTTITLFSINRLNLPPLRFYKQKTPLLAGVGQLELKYNIKIVLTNYFGYSHWSTQSV